MTTSQNPTASVSIADITAAVNEIVADELGVTPASIAPGRDLRAMEGTDSVKVLRIIARIETDYEIELDDEDVFGVSSVAELADFVYQALVAS